MGCFTSHPQGKSKRTERNVKWWQLPLIQGARTIGSPSGEAIWRPSPVFCTASSSRPVAPSPDLLPSPTGVGFLPSFDHVKEKSVAEVCCGRNQRAGEQRVTTPVELRTSVQRLALAGVASEFSSLPQCPVGVTVQDAVTHFLGQGPGYVDDMARGKTCSLSSCGLGSLPRVQAGLIPLSSVVPSKVHSLLEDDATSTFLQR